MTADRKVSLLTMALTVALARHALAESPLATEQPPPRWRPLSSFGMTVAAGGGVTDFTGSATRSLTQIGGSWDVRLAFRTRRSLGFEVSYIGGANTVHGLGFGSSDTKLIRNGVEAMLRLNVPRYARDVLLEPYLAGGIGWNGYRITNASATASASPTDTNTLAFPLSIGFVVGYKGFIVDARGTLRPTAGQSTLLDEGSGALTNWDAGCMVGYEF